MADRGEAAHVVGLHAAAILVGMAAGERRRGRQLRRQVFGRQRRLVEMPAPDQQVLDGRGEAALAALRIGVRGAAEAALEIAEISRGEARDHRVDLVHQLRAGHAERPEDALGEDVAQLLAGDLSR